jgi:sugar O-acyltransferase (sialic acid O-acetyltransferase NeuD family)
MDVVIFGLGQQASVSWLNLTHDSPHRVVAFTVDAAYCDRDTLHGLPVVAFEDLAERYPPDRVALLIPLSYRHMNRLRTEKFAQAKARGYSCISYVSQRAIVWPDLKLGENCIIQAGANIQPFVEIGDNCMLMAGATIGHHSRLGDHCFLAAEAVLGGGTEIGAGCVIGINGTVRNAVRVASRCLVGAGAVVAADTEPDGIYVGVPARRQAHSVDEAEEAGR